MISTGLIILLSVILALQYYRLRKIKHSIDAILEAGTAEKIILIDHQEKQLRHYNLEKLQALFNRFIESKSNLSHLQQGYQNQIKATLENMQEAVFLVDWDNYILVANKAARNVFTNLNSPHFAKEQRLERIIHGSDLVNYIRQLKQGKPLPEKEIIIAKQGQDIWFEVSGTRIASEAAQKPLLLLVLHDITRLKRLESVRQEFVANVSHELRTPVTIIKGFTDMLVDEPQMRESDRKRFLQKIQKNVSRLHLLLEDLLMLSQLELCEDSIKGEPLLLDKVVQEGIQEFCSNRPPPPIEIKFTSEGNDFQLTLDSIRISQIIHNLLDNALRYAKGATEIIVKVIRKENTLILEVRDNGCGIPTRDLQHIFERFYRVDKGRFRGQDDIAGTGLGLSIVKHIVQLHGGWVNAESKEGVGTAIQCIWPIGTLTPCICDPAIAPR